MLQGRESAKLRRRPTLPLARGSESVTTPTSAPQEHLGRGVAALRAHASDSVETGPRVFAGLLATRVPCRSSAASERLMNWSPIASAVRRSIVCGRRRQRRSSHCGLGSAWSRPPHPATSTTLKANLMRWKPASTHNCARPHLRCAWSEVSTLVRAGARPSIATPPTPGCISLARDCV